MHVMEPFHPHGGFRICWDLSAFLGRFGLGEGDKPDTLQWKMDSPNFHGNTS